MNSVMQSQLREVLEDQRASLVEQWYAVLEKVSPVPPKQEKVTASLSVLADQMIDLCLAETFKRQEAQAIGAALHNVCDIPPEGIVRIQEALADYIIAPLAPKQVTALQPNLVKVLANLGLGFLVESTSQRKKLNMASVSKMGHDLKTPINSITGFSRVILKGIDGPITDFQQQDLTSIYNAGKLLLDMINELTQVSKQDEGKLELYIDDFDLAVLAGDIITTMQPLLAENDHALALHCIGELGTMHANMSQVRWVALSLLLHAARGMEPGTLLLTISREMVDGKDWIFFRISRNVPMLHTELVGLEPETEEAIKESHKDLALITGERFCEAMGGKISVIQTNGDGVTFTARIPAKVTVIEDNE